LKISVDTDHHDAIQCCRWSITCGGTRIRRMYDM